MKKPIISQKFLDAINQTHTKASALMSNLPSEAIALSGYVSNQKSTQVKSSTIKSVK